jgi:hypothetical protein
MKCDAEFCSKRLTIVDRELVCRCGKKLCPRHRMFTNHTCVKVEFKPAARDPQRMLSHAPTDPNAAY